MPIDLTNIDGSGTAATNGEDVTTAIMNAVNSANLGVVASKAFVGGTRQIIFTSTELGEAFTVQEMTFTDAANSGSQGSLGLVSCLLYTSPSPRDATLSRMPSSA